ncbi:MAG TPA: DUF503 domain-containing protein [Acidimicrobiales bacterium]|nr:DUF503 domain-containing protein [Acidimicrobiales bacterium]
MSAANATMHVAAICFDLRLATCRSLKEKRAVIKPILDGARNRYRVAAAEVGRQDQWQRAELGMAVVASTAGHASDVLDQVERFVWSFPEVEVLTTERTWAE